MPSVSEFFGLSFEFVFQDHNPPHFHIMRGKSKVATVSINDIEFIGETGDLTNKQKKAILGWTSVYQDELLANWNVAKNGGILQKIPPLTKAVI
jgi:hypothetical protein